MKHYVRPFALSKYTKGFTLSNLACLVVGRDVGLAVRVRARLRKGVRRYQYHVRTMG